MKSAVLFINTQTALKCSRAWLLWETCRMTISLCCGWALLFSWKRGIKQIMFVFCAWNHLRRIVTDAEMSCSLCFIAHISLRRLNVSHQRDRILIRSHPNNVNLLSGIWKSIWHDSCIYFPLYSARVKVSYSPCFDWYSYIHTGFCRTHMLVLWMITAFVTWRALLVSWVGLFKWKTGFHLWWTYEGSWQVLVRRRRGGGRRAPEDKRPETKQKLDKGPKSPPGTPLCSLFLPRCSCSHRFEELNSFVWDFMLIWILFRPLTLAQMFYLNWEKGVEKTSWQHLHQIFNDACLNWAEWITSVIGHHLRRDKLIWKFNGWRTWPALSFTRQNISRKRREHERFQVSTCVQNDGRLVQTKFR